ncbi:MAG TPA: hypothetical protein VMZ91_08030 [Candidatus Paceibacterota bacterium]|nr:hypothetical protein [Candidatus Paceibacterota bacterium]
MKSWLIAGGIGLVAVIVIISMFVWSMGVYKTEVGLSNRYDAQFNVVETSLDQMRNTLVNQFKVNKKFAEDFVKVAMAQSEGRKGGGLFKSFTEASNKLGIDQEMYIKMMNAIEGQLAAFKSSQDTLTDVWREHKTFCENPWHNILWLALNEKVKPQPKMISTSITKKAVETKILDANLLE